MPEEIEIIVDKASDLLKLPMREAVNLKTLTVSGFDIQSFGKVQLCGHHLFKLNKYFLLTFD